jgi:hypothetical protein
MGRVLADGTPSGDDALQVIKVGQEACSLRKRLAVDAQALTDPTTGQQSGDAQLVEERRCMSAAITLQGVAG